MAWHGMAWHDMAMQRSAPTVVCCRQSIPQHSYPGAGHARRRAGCLFDYERTSIHDDKQCSSLARWYLQLLPLSRHAVLVELMHC